MHDERLIKGIAAERMGRLLDLAYERTMGRDTDALSSRYVKLAREISSHYKVRMGRKEKNRFCRKCNAMLIPGKTCKVIMASGNKQMVYKCRCGTERRIFYK